MTINEVVEAIRVTPDCRVLPAQGGLEVLPKHTVPEDVRVFYQICGGVHLFENSNYPCSIMVAQDVVLAHKRFYGNVFEQVCLTEFDGSIQFRNSAKDDISMDWYAIVDVSDGNYVSIDFHPSRLGRCYDSFFDTYAVPGSCAVVARSFTELLFNLLEAKGTYFFWLEPTFKYIADAYDVASDD